MKKNLLHSLLIGCIAAFSITPTFASTTEPIPITTPEESEPLANLISFTRTAGVGKITGSNVRLRKEPGLSSDIICYLQKGDIVELGSECVAKDGYYWQIVGYNGTWGYVATEYVQEMPS